MSRIILTAILLSSFLSGASAQDDYEWWNHLHHWDGVTPWNRYLTISPKYFGPNALPVPEVRTGVPDSVFSFETSAGAHFSRGDKTEDFVLNCIFPVAKGKASVEAAVVPLEFYSMDTVTRDIRAARDRDGHGRAGGDILVSTIVQLVKCRRSIPDISIEIGLRTASGTQLGAARYTDAPGYHFDLSFGKKYVLPFTLPVSLRPYAMAGFYSYQTFDVQHLQNDCLLWGAGIDLHKGAWFFNVQLAGYYGYLKNGDQPMVFRSSVRHIGRRVDPMLRLQIGLHDFEYRSVHAGVAWKFIGK